MGDTAADDDDRFESFVKEAPILIELIHKICDVSNNEPVASVDIKFQELLDKYMEQPTLLDPHLRDMIPPLMVCVRRNHPRLHRVSMTVYNLCRVRGHKTIMRFFPHAVADLEPTFQLLMDMRAESAINKIGHNWQTEYTLLVWLSMLVLIPFDLVTVDSAMKKDDTDSPLINNIISVCKAYLTSPGIDKEGAALLLARLLTRPDMSGNLRQFLEWAKTAVSTDANPSAAHESELLTAGVLMTLARIFKHGKRDEVLPFTEGMIDFVINLQSSTTGAVSSKLCVKVIQRISLLHLPPRVASWRYERGMRSLGDNLEASVGAHSDNAMSELQQQPPQHSGGEDETIVIPDNLEEVIGFLLTSLKCRDTPTRWSAAKGVGRITCRIPEHLADEVVSGVLDLITDEQSDTAWHGACLAIGEMARRGVLLPARLPHAIPVVVQALKFEKRRGGFSVGSHVRDAACYVCWAFGRAYAPAVLKPYVLEMSRALLITACYDREVNCRRAASAAFQENVGRQGTFPRGIEILAKADYFALGNRTNAYTDISVFIAGFDEYRASLVNHLIEFKLNNWDQQVREVASKALHKLALLDPPLLAATLPALAARIGALEPLEREGVLLGMGEIVLGIYNAGQSITDTTTLAQIQQIVPVIQKKRLFRGKGGEYVRAAVSRFVECIASTPMPYPHDLVVMTIGLLEENLKNPQEYIQQSAVNAIKAVAKSYLSGATEYDLELCRRYITLAGDRLAHVSRGFTSVLGVLPATMLHPHFNEAVRVLTKAMEIQLIAEERDPETRRNATVALTSAAITFGTAFPSELSAETVAIVSGGVLLGLEDFSVDNRGDVGSWVRAVAITAGADWMRFLVSHWKALNNPDAPFLLPEITCTRIIGSLLRQLTGRLDRLRLRAGEELTALIHETSRDTPLTRLIAHHDVLMSAFAPQLNQLSRRVTMWTMERVLALCAPLLALNEYRLFVLEGWSTCTDPINGFHKASVAVHELVQTMTACEGSRDKRGTCCAVVLELVRMMCDRQQPPRSSNPTPARLIPCAVVTLARLIEGLTITQFEALTVPPMAPRYIQLQQQQQQQQQHQDANSNDLGGWRWVIENSPSYHDPIIVNSNDDSAVTSTMDHVVSLIITSLEKKLLAKDFGVVVNTVNILCALSWSAGEHRLAALQHVMYCLTDHPWPRVRKITADQLYVHLLSSTDMVSCSQDDITDLVTTTPWIGPLEESEDARTRIYAAFGIPLVPRVSVGPVLEAAQPSMDEGASYADFVNDIVRGL